MHAGDASLALRDDASHDFAGSSAERRRYAVAAPMHMLVVLRKDLAIHGSALPENPGGRASPRPRGLSQEYGTCLVDGIDARVEHTRAPRGTSAGRIGASERVVG